MRAVLYQMGREYADYLFVNPFEPLLGPQTGYPFILHTVPHFNSFGLGKVLPVVKHKRRQILV